MGVDLDRRAVTWGLVAVAVTVAMVILGSAGLRWFDAALVGYLFGVLFAIFGTVYRYAVWLRRPPTAVMRRRGWQAFFDRDIRRGNLRMVPGLVGANLLAQSFISKRSRLRWIAHQLVFWGCVLAVLVTFPLVFGWFHFESVGQRGREYQAFVAGFGTITFGSRTPFGWVVFHLLDISAVLVLAGVFIFLSRRLRDPGALAVERANDFLPLAGLFAVSVTGIMLTVSNLWMEGRFYTFITTLHALTVILGLMYVPFGKLFHIFQRPANLGAEFYKRAGAHGPQQACRECGAQFASALQMGDLKEEVLPRMGFDYRLDDGHWQDVCPRCRRRLFALAQSARVGGFG
ncbi:MAG: MFS transporter [Acidimicrobiia bacterium]|nr:MFS transporter [Acidimicrobiia bacterium]